ncbi:MAG TPA: hypothetical protein DCW68_05380 [Rhodospirillaceae bacterium]|nr:MAG: hypothetical protein A2018_02270 [Alphaproteobacteria bacterium GWF2_58_20]HAU29527.1 hypothetical protein [Rhodospirillaceae bacterium]
MRIFIGVILPIIFMATTGLLALHYLGGAPTNNQTATRDLPIAQLIGSTMPSKPQKEEKSFISPAGQAEAAAIANETAQVVSAFNMYVGTMGETLPKTPQDLVSSGFIGGIPNPPGSGKGAKFFFVHGHDKNTMALATRIFSKDTCNAINQSALATTIPIIREAGPFAPEFVDITPAISGTAFSCAHFALSSPTPEYYYLRRLH